MGFLEKDVATRSSDGRNEVLIEPLHYQTEKGEIITVPVGADTDGASVPRIFWRLFPPTGDYWMAAVLHDHLYRTNMFVKSKCDRIFLEAMKSLGVGRVKRETIYMAVHYFGFAAYNEARRNIKMKKMKIVGAALLLMAVVAGSVKAEPVKFRVNSKTTVVVPFQVVNVTQLYSFDLGRGFPAAETPLFLFGSRERAQFTFGAAPKFETSSDMPFVGLQTRLSDRIFDTSDNEVFFGVYAGHREGEGVEHPKRVFNDVGIKASVAFW